MLLPTLSHFLFDIAAHCWLFSADLDISLYVCLLVPLTNVIGSSDLQKFVHFHNPPFSISRFDFILVNLLFFSPLHVTKRNTRKISHFVVHVVNSSI